MRVSKLKIILTSLTAFALVFGALNFGYIKTNVKYWLSSRDGISSANAQTFPLAGNKADSPLPSNAVLVIDSLGVSVPIVFDAPDTIDGVFDNLEKGVVNYSQSSKPGEDGVAIILGHSSSYPWYKGDYGSVFALLGKLNPGDKFYVRYSDGRIFNYQVKKSIVFNPDSDDPRIVEIETNPNPSVALVSCWPVGTAAKRIAVQAEQI